MADKLPKPQGTEWYRTRPLAVQKRIDEYPPTWLYRMRSTGQIVYLYSYTEEDDVCDTCIVDIVPAYNPGMIVARRVFDVSLNDLEKLTEDPNWRP